MSLTFEVPGFHVLKFLLISFLLLGSDRLPIPRYYIRDRVRELRRRD
jgi:hypothetical protein